MRVDENTDMTLAAVSMLVSQLESFISNPAEDKSIRLEMYDDWAEVSTHTYESIWKSGTVPSSNEEKMQQTAIIMKADHRDSHKGFTSAETVMKACQSYNAMGNGAMGVQHALALEADTMQMIESYIAPKDFDITNDAGEVLVEVKKGDWVGTAQYNNPFFWNMAKTGELDSFSIEADGLITYDEGEELA